jgi:hypothetical protein
MTAVTLWQRQNDVNTWTLTRYARLHSRARACFRCLDHERRKDAVAGVLAMAMALVREHSASSVQEWLVSWAGVHYIGIQLVRRCRRARAR